MSNMQKKMGWLGIAAVFTGNAVQSYAQQQQPVTVHFNAGTTYQTVRNFAASDAWCGQFVGNWPAAKKNQVADWLFSRDTLPNGAPKGIGLSLWRVNLGAGSTQQGDSSGIRDEWRRAASFRAKGSKEVQAQLWWMQAAKARGVTQFLGFYNSPPVHITRNGKAFATGGKTNLDSTAYNAFALEAVKDIQEVKKQTGIRLNYLSPVNEPQWDWSDGGQEGCPYFNNDIYGVVKAMHQAFVSNRIATKLLVTEAGQYNYLLPQSNKPGKDNQVQAFFQPGESCYIGNLSSVSNTIAAHSYFTTSPATDAIAMRKRIGNQVAGVKGLEFWQSEYCILGDNAGEINGSKKDTGITAALYLAGVVHNDLVYANAAAWQWWLAISAYNYKDGLIYVDKNKADGNYSDSKMLWALGNYSRFVRPGMQRIAVDAPGTLRVSGFVDGVARELVFVVVNAESQSQLLNFVNDVAGVNDATAQAIVYTTSHAGGLQKSYSSINNTVIPAQSIVTVVVHYNKK
ncbi:O-Glycosyl hydrolase [Filimonas lacunae]|uniref:O-Glycosyl hydrolase n=1 Tax=Filimonas lacunae TaxID=477680 RepID=A0A173MN41_9BACT|nr:glycoside hydrolase [Filimonas lacunae]BAV08906.1 xylanase [Filimonas lacunae]SIS63787.1 O-Glycosyl hydrolase [Filimonas lacunae]